MQRIFWVFVVLYALLPTYGQQKITMADIGQKSAYPAASTSQVTDTSVNQEACKTNTERTQDQSNYFRTFFSANNLPNVLLVVIGFGAIIFAWKTVNATKDAAKLPC